MKRISISVAIGFGLLFSSACDSSDVKADVKAPRGAPDISADADAEAHHDATPEEAAAPDKAPEQAVNVDAPKHALFVRHKVADYDKWFASFDAGEAKRAQMGAIAQYVYRDRIDSSIVMVSMVGTFDPDRLAETFDGDEMKATMAAAGVEGEPETTLYEIMDQQTSEAEVVSHAFAFHEVADYDEWKAGFDAHKDARLAGGVIAWGVGREVGAPNKVAVHLAVGDAIKFNVMMGSDEMKSAMRDAGVQGEPIVYSAGPHDNEKAIGAPVEAAAGAERAAPAEAAAPQAAADK